MIKTITTRDVRVPIGSGHGSDAIHRNPVYSYAVTLLHDDSGLTGSGLAFTLGQGNDLVCQAAEFLARDLAGKDIEEIMTNFGSWQTTASNEQQFRWLGPHKGVVHLALASVTNACWDLWAKKRGLPLWRLLLDLTPTEVVNTLDLSYLEDVVTNHEASDLLTGPNDGLVIPHGSTKTDWEVELGVVMGKVTRRVSQEEAMSHIAGYVLHNDYSEWEWQLERGGQWVKGKSADTFAPLGPWLATSDELPDPGNLSLTLSVNGVTKQNGHTKNLIFGVPFLIHYLSQFMTLLPGDVISTGTPAGVGLGFKPPQYLKPGDIISLSITGLGSQRQEARAEI